MARSIVPWHVFFETLQKSQTAELDTWLDRWRFNDDGAILGHENKPLDTKPSSWKGKQLAHLRLILGKRSRTVH